MAPTARGFWGKPTSTLNWCESDYEVTQLVAEFWNTLSNLFIIVPALAACYYATRDGQEKKILASHFLLFVVGLGSWCFHMTLLYQMQLLDELPMVYLCLVSIYCLVTVLWPQLGNSLPFQLGLLFCGYSITLTYTSLKNPLLFQVSYGALVVSMCFLDICILTQKSCHKRLFCSALSMYVFGFILWNIDNVYCQRLHQWRQRLPPYATPFLQLHSWWHFLAGYGSFLHILFCAHVRHQSCSDKRCSLIWTWAGIQLRLNNEPDKKGTFNNWKEDSLTLPRSLSHLQTKSQTHTQTHAQNQKQNQSQNQSPSQSVVSISGATGVKRFST